MKLILIIFFISSTTFAVDFSLPNTPESGIGDMGSFYLAEPDNFTFHLMNNDFLGNTDKLMTGSLSFNYFKSLKPLLTEHNTKVSRSLHFGINRRIITPILQTRFNNNMLDTPEGNYLDWIELKFSYSQLINRWKTELSASLDMFGNFDGKYIQATLHKIIGSEDKTSEYGNSSKGVYGGGVAGIGYLITDELLSMAYFHKNEIMQDWIVRLSYAKKINQIEVAGQTSVAIQNYSNNYSNISKERYEWAISLKYKWWQMNTGYISKYLVNDDYGQFFIDPLIIHFDF